MISRLLILLHLYIRAVLPVLLKNYWKYRNQLESKHFFYFINKISKPMPDDLNNVKLLPAQTMTLLEIAVSSMAILSKKEKESHDALQKMPNANGRFGIESENWSLSFEIKNGVVSLKKNISEKTDVELWFKNLRVAHEAVTHQLDPMAAVGKKDIVIKGFIPLADTLGYVMDRVELYLQPKT
jgi:hypothetical protein